VSISVEAGSCLDLFLLPSEQVAHVELELIDDGGRRIGIGQVRGAERSLIVCSEERRELTVRSRPHRGRGLAALVVSASAAGGAERLSSDARRHDLRPSGSIDVRREQLAARLGSYSRGAARLLHRGRLESARRMSLPLRLARGCSRIDVLSAAPVQALGAWLWSDSDELIARAAGGIDATLFACSPGQRARLDLESLSSAGELSVELRHDSRLPAALTRSALAASRLLELMNARGHLRSLDDLPEVSALQVSATSLAPVELRIASGRCLELLAAVGAGASGLEARLFERPDDADAAFDAGDLGYGESAASARFCAPDRGGERALQGELRVNAGAGTALWAARSFDPAGSVEHGPPAR
jgi:hypothetical protein